jgi:hypothetical protein
MKNNHRIPQADRCTLSHQVAQLLDSPKTSLSQQGGGLQHSISSLSYLNVDVGGDSDSDESDMEMVRENQVKHVVRIRMRSAVHGDGEGRLIIAAGRSRLELSIQMNGQSIQFKYE